MAGQGLGQGRCLRADAGAGRSDRAGRHRHWHTGQLQRLSGRRRIPAADPVSGAVLRQSQHGQRLSLRPTGQRRAAGQVVLLRQHGRGRLRRI